MSNSPKKTEKGEDAEQEIARVLNFRSRIRRTDTIEVIDITEKGRRRRGRRRGGKESVIII